MKCGICPGLCTAQPAVMVTHVKSALTYTSDGPLTPFVLISRAVEVAMHAGAERATGMIGSEPTEEHISNALHEALTEHGWIVDDQDVLDGLPAGLALTGS